MKKYTYLPLFLLVINHSYAGSMFESSSYATSSTSEKEMVNGQLVKSTHSHKDISNELGTKNGKIIHEKSDINENVSDADRIMGMSYSGEDYFNFDGAQQTKVIKLVAGSCSITALGNGFTDTHLSVVKKNSQKNKIGDFLFGIFNYLYGKVTAYTANSVLESFTQNQYASDIERIADGLRVAAEFNDSIGYKGVLDAGVGILRDSSPSKKELTVWCPFGCKVAVMSKGTLRVCEEVALFRNIVKGDIILFANNTFWNAIHPEKAIKFARKNISRKSRAASAITTAEKLITMARDQGANEAMNLLLIYIL